MFVHFIQDANVMPEFQFCHSRFPRGHCSLWSLWHSRSWLGLTQHGVTQKALSSKSRFVCFGLTNPYNIQHPYCLKWPGVIGLSCWLGTRTGHTGSAGKLAEPVRGLVTFYWTNLNLLWYILSCYTFWTLLSELCLWPPWLWLEAVVWALWLDWKNGNEQIFLRNYFLIKK